jgi:hypothetical protein
MRISPRISARSADSLTTTKDYTDQNSRRRRVLASPPYRFISKVGDRYFVAAS